MTFASSIGEKSAKSQQDTSGDALAERIAEVASVELQVIWFPQRW